MVQGNGRTVRCVLLARGVVPVGWVIVLFSPMTTLLIPCYPHKVILTRSSSQGLSGRRRFAVDRRLLSILKRLFQQEAGKVAHGAPLAKAHLSQFLVDSLGNCDRDSLWFEQGIGPKSFAHEITLGHNARTFGDFLNISQA